MRVREVRIRMVWVLQRITLHMVIFILVMLCCGRCWRHYCGPCNMATFKVLFLVDRRVFVCQRLLHLIVVITITIYLLE